MLFNKKNRFLSIFHFNIFVNCLISPTKCNETLVVTLILAFSHLPSDSLTPPKFPRGSRSFFGKDFIWLQTFFQKN